MSTTTKNGGGRLARVLLAATLLTGVVLSQAAIPEPAHAATEGAGISNITPYGGYLGNYIVPDGTRTYCIDSSADWPSGNTSGGTQVNGLTTSYGSGLSALQLSRLNYALVKWGQTADPVQAAAVNAYLYAYTSGYAGFTGQGYAAGAHFINGNSAVTADYNVIWNESESYSGVPSGGGSATIDITMTNGYDGYVTITTNPTNAIGTLTLSGATVVSTGTNTATVHNGSVVPIKGIPIDDQGKYVISADATFSAPGGADSSVTMYTTPGQQRTIREGGVTSFNFSATHETTDPVGTEFSPIVGTQVASQFVDVGSVFTDTATASVAAGSNVWRQRSNGTYYAVPAKATLYGPFADQPVPAADVPAGAPVVETVPVTLDGPGSYTATPTVTAAAAGYYTWVWSIDAADASPVTQLYLPTDYHFADQFGLVAETHIVPIDLTAVSEVSTSQAGLSSEITDQLTVLLASGTWLSEGGAPVPAVFNGTAYFVPGDTAPAVSVGVPADAVAIGTATVTAAGPGVYQGSNPVTAPSSTAGYVTWVWSLATDSAYSSYFEGWTDLFGMPSETTRILAPTVMTQAVPSAPLGDPAHDTAIVGGTLPAQNGYIVFDAYLQVLDSPAPVCDDTTHVYSSADAPITVTQSGSYDSPTTAFTEYGTYFWVESLFSYDDQVIHQGVCGEEGESTVVSPATVATNATAAVELGTAAHDTATVTGSVPAGATLVFEAFKQAGEVAVCDTSTSVFSSATSPVAVTGAGTYDSPSTTFTTVGTYFWVETLLDRTGAVLHVGECGAPSETTLVSPVVVHPAGLALTGSSIAVVPVLWVGAGLLSLGACILIVVGVRRKKTRTE